MKCYMSVPLKFTKIDLYSIIKTQTLTKWLNIIKTKLNNAKADILLQDWMFLAEYKWNVLSVNMLQAR